MTNLEIIANELVERGLYTENEINEILIKTGQLPIATYQEWKKRGYQVKRGEKSIITIFIWKHKEKTVKNENTENEEIDPEKFIKVKAYFFKKMQVEKIK